MTTDGDAEQEFDRMDREFEADIQRWIKVE